MVDRTALGPSFNRRRSYRTQNSLARVQSQAQAQTNWPYPQRTVRTDQGTSAVVSNNTSPSASPDLQRNVTSSIADSAELDSQDIASVHSIDSEELPQSYSEDLSPLEHDDAGQPRTAHSTASTGTLATLLSRIDLMLGDDDDDDEEVESDLEQLSTVAAPRDVNSRPVTRDGNIINPEDDGEAAQTDPKFPDPLAEQYASAEQFNDHSAFLIALGLWADTSQIPQDDYKALAEVLTLVLPPEVASVLPRTLPTLKRYRRFLPLLTLRGKQVSLDASKIPSRVDDKGTIFYFDKREILQATLNIPEAQHDMYFGPALLCTEVSQPWHGELWAQSILCSSGRFPFYPAARGGSVLACEAIFPADVVLRRNGNLVFVSSIWKDCRHNAADTAPWLFMVQPIIPLDNNNPPLQYALVEDTHEMTFASLDPVAPIALGFDCSDPRRPSIHVIQDAANHRRRPSCQRQPLLAETEQTYFRDLGGRAHMQRQFVTRRTTDKAIMCIPTFDFVDGFGLYRNMRRSLLGIYSTPANLKTLRRQQRFNSTITLGPFGASYNDVISTIGPGYRQLAHGMDMVIDRPDGRDTVFVCSFPLALTGDMPQQSKNAGCLEPGATRFCRCCRVKKEECKKSVLEDDWLDADTSRTRWPAEELARRSSARNNRSLAEDGLSQTPPIWQRYIPLTIQQLPWDFNHLQIKGMGERMHNIIIFSLSESGRRALTNALRMVPLPAGWARLQSPTVHYGSYSITEVAELSILLPFLLRSLDIKAFKDSQAAILVRELELDNASQLLNRLTTIYANFSASMQIGLQEKLPRSMSDDYDCMTERRDYLKLKEVYQRSRDSKVLSQTEQFPNLHGGIHLPDDLKRFATFVNVNTTLGEEMHKVYKSAAPYTNHVETHLQLLRRVNVLRTVQLVMDLDTSDHAPDMDPGLLMLREALDQFTEACPTLMGRICRKTKQSHRPTRLTKRLTGRQVAQLPRTVQLDLKTLTGQQSLLQSYSLINSRRLTVESQLAYYSACATDLCPSNADSPAKIRHTFRVGRPIWYPRSSTTTEPERIATIEAIIQHEQGQIFVRLSPWQHVGLDNYAGAHVYTRAKNIDALGPLPLIPLELLTDMIADPHLVDCSIIQSASARQRFLNDVPQLADMRDVFDTHHVAWLNHFTKRVH